MKLVTLDPKAKYQEEVIKMAELILERAKSGEYIDLTYCASLRNGEVMTAFTATENAHVRLSAVSRVLHRLHMSEADHK